MRPRVNRYGAPIYSDGQIKRLAVPAATRRAIALRYGATPGREDSPAECAYCGAEGSIFWPTLASGRPGSWVNFTGLQLEHVVAYSKGGNNRDPDNFVLACKSCNSSKGDKTIEQWIGHHEWLAEVS